MMAMAAVAGPQHRMSCLRMVGDGEKLVFGKSGALRVGLRTHGGGVGLSISLANRAPQWARVAALSEDATSTEVAAVEEQPAVPAYEGPTVKVTFELQRECHFGQQFKVVGGDAQFGDWDPTAAVPLNWSEGHVWTADVDVPEGKEVEFKYILAGQKGEVEWQPGSNLVLEAAAGAGSLLVSEPWEASPPAAAEPEVATDWEEKTTIPEEDTTTPADSLADAAASAAVGALNAGVKAATALEGGLDAVTDSPNGVAESGKAEEKPTAVEIPVVDAALAAAAAPPAPAPPAAAAAAPATGAAPPAAAAAAPAEETEIGNGAIESSQERLGNKEQSKIEEQQSKIEEQQSKIEEQQSKIEEQQSKIEEQQPRIEEPQPRIEEPQQPQAERKKRLNPFQKDIEWLSSLFGR